MIPISIMAGWVTSVAYVSALSLWALLSGHWSAWQAARVEVCPRGCRGAGRRPDGRRDGDRSRRNLNRRPARWSRQTSGREEDGRAEARVRPARPFHGEMTRSSSGAKMPVRDVSGAGVSRGQHGNANGHESRNDLQQLDAVDAHEAEERVVALLEIASSVLHLDGGELAPQNLNQEVARPTGGFQDTRVDAFGLGLNEVKHCLDHPRGVKISP